MITAGTPVSGMQFNPNSTFAGFPGDKGITGANDPRFKRPMPAGKFSFTGNPVDRQMYENFATPPGSAYASTTSGSSTYSQ